MNQIIEISEQTNQIEVAVKESGLQIEEGEQIKQSYLPFLNDLSSIMEQSKKINFDTPVDIDEKIARDLRLKTVKIRTGASDLKDSRKRIHLLKGNLEQAAFNIISASCKLAEETFINVEKAREMAEKKMKEERKSLRVQKLTELEYNYTFTDILNMPDEQFEKLVISIENELSAKKEAERKAEEEKVQREMAVQLHNKRREFIIPLWNYTTDEQKNMNLSVMSQDEFDVFCSELLELKAKDDLQELLVLVGRNSTVNKVIRKKDEFDVFCSELLELKAKDDQEKERIKIENEKLKKEAEEKEIKLKAERLEAERLAKIETEKQEAEKKANELQLQKERELAAEKLRIETDARLKLEAEIKEKQEAENMKKAEEEVKAAKELKDKLTAEKKAKNAPDKTKLIELIKKIDNIDLPELSGDDAKNILENVKTLLAKVSVYILDQSAKL